MQWQEQPQTVTCLSKWLHHYFLASPKTDFLTTTPLLLKALRFQSLLFHPQNFSLNRKIKTPETNIYGTVQMKQNVAGCFWTELSFPFCSSQLSTFICQQPGSCAAFQVCSTALPLTGLSILQRIMLAVKITVELFWKRQASDGQFRFHRSWKRICRFKLLINTLPGRGQEQSASTEFSWT